MNTHQNNRQVLTRIVLLRCLALSLALCLIVTFEFALKREIVSPLVIFTVCLGLVLLLLSALRLKRSKPIGIFEIGFQLLADAILLVILVSLSGGATNPFIYYYLVLIAVSAAVLPQRGAWIYCGKAIVIYSLLMLLDLDGHSHHALNDFQLHLIGMWFNFVASAVLICLFISRFSKALQLREASIAKMREENLRNEQLIGVATLATSTAHHLGTPLNSVSVLLSELDLNADISQVKADIQLALKQLERAKDSLQNLRQLAEPQLQSGRTFNLDQLKKVILEHFSFSNPKLQPEFKLSKELSRTFCETDIFLQHALINLIENAIRAAHTRVTLRALVKDEILNLIIEDDGKGFSSEQLENWGQALATSEGLGIGIFLANHTIEKANGRVFATRTASQLTQVLIELPLRKSTNCPE